MISISTKMPYQEVREIFLRSGKCQGRWKSKKVATLSYNKKTTHIPHEHFQTGDQFTSLPPKLAKLVFKANTGMLNIKANFKTKL